MHQIAYFPQENLNIFLGWGEAFRLSLRLRHGARRLYGRRFGPCYRKRHPHSAPIRKRLDGQGKARREAARRRNSECKINPLVAMAVGLSAAVIGWQRGAATNVTRCRPITAAQ